MRDLRGRRDTADEGLVAEVLDADFCRRLFGSLHRTGQRVKAEQYVRGLLSVRGRKTLRSVAARAEGASARQSAHHFITASPWEWTPIRHALARQAQRLLAPTAWVIGSTLIPKAGPHSVGTDPQPTLPGTVNGRQAVGTRLVSERSVVPVVVPPAGRDVMTLMAEWCPGRRAERRLWLIGRAPSCLPAALSLARLPEVVQRDFAEISDGGGLRDFAGRSFPGRHRHITPASVTHLVALAARHGPRGGPAELRSDVTEAKRTTVR